MYNIGYVDRQFLLAIVSLDPWELLRNYALPDEFELYTSMEEKKKKMGEIEAMILSDKYSGIRRIDSKKFLVTSPIFQSMELDSINYLNAPSLYLELFQDYVKIKTDLLGFHPAYFASTESGGFFSTRMEWLKKLVANIFEMANASEIEMSLNAFYLKRTEFKQAPPQDIDGILNEGIKKFREIIKNLEADLYFHVQRNPLTLFALIEYFNNLDMGNSLTILLESDKDSEVIKNVLRENDIGFKEMRKLEILSENKKISTKVEKIDYLEDIPNIYTITTSKPSLFLVDLISSILKNTPLKAPESIVDVIYKQHLYLSLRELHKAIWPSSFIDPLLIGEIPLLSLADLKNFIESKIGKNFGHIF
ncbi:MAG: hypothetical protein ACP6IP_01835 [Candidatus Njordarchaeia archaeon]